MLDKLKSPCLPDETKAKIYNNGLHPFISETGKLIARIPRAINAALAPLDCWILTKENNVTKVNLLLEEKLKILIPIKSLLLNHMLQFLQFKLCHIQLIAMSYEICMPICSLNPYTQILKIRFIQPMLKSSKIYLL